MMHYTLKEAAELLGLSPNSLRGRLFRGTLQGTKDAEGSWLLDKPTVDALIEANTPKPQAVSASSVFDSLVAKWVASMESGTLTGQPFSPFTVGTYTSNLKLYFKRLGLEPSLEAVSPEHYERYCQVVSNEGGGYNPKADAHRSLMCLAKWLVKRGYWQPAQRAELNELKPKQVGKPRRRKFNHATFEKLLRHNQAHATGRGGSPVASVDIAFKLMFYAGLRLGETVELKWADVKHEPFPHIVVVGKGSKRRLVGLLPTLVDDLIAWRRINPYPHVVVNKLGKGYTRGGFSCLCRKIIKPSGIDIDLHGLRRSGATYWLMELGAATTTVQNQLGHSDLKTTEMYLELQDMQHAGFLAKLGG